MGGGGLGAGYASSHCSSRGFLPLHQRPRRFIRRNGEPEDDAGQDERQPVAPEHQFETVIVDEVPAQGRADGEAQVDRQPLEPVALHEPPLRRVNGDGRPVGRPEGIRDQGDGKGQAAQGPERADLAKRHVEHPRPEHAVELNVPRAVAIVKQPPEVVAQHATGPEGGHDVPGRDGRVILLVDQVNGEKSDHHGPAAVDEHDQREQPHLAGQAGESLDVKVEETL